MIAIKALQKDKILLISFDGSKRYLVEKEKLNKSGLHLGSMCEVEVKDYAPKKFKKFTHPSGLYFEVVGKQESAVGKGTFGTLRKQKGSAFFETELFGRVACVDDGITISKLDKLHPIIVTILSEDFKVGENSVCHWGAIIDESPQSKSKSFLSNVHTKPEKVFFKNNNNINLNKEKEKPKDNAPTKVQKQCVGVVTKVDTTDENVKNYFCWLTDEHLSSILFDQPKKTLHLQRGDFFRANFVKFKGCQKWKFVSFIERIEPLTIINFHKDTISLIVRLQNIKRAHDSDYRANTEAYHPIVGTIVDCWNILSIMDSDGIEVKVVMHKFNGEYCWAISSKTSQ